MEQGNQGWTSPQLCRLLAGLEAGIWGGLAMLGWFALAATASHRSIWAVPNLLARLFCGQPGPRSGFSAATLPGLGLILFTCGTVGILFALLVREPARRLRVRLLGLLAGLIWYYLSTALFWNRLGPIVSVYSPPPSMMAAYLVFGAVLWVYPCRLRSLRRPPPDVPAATASSGESPLIPPEP